jgi:hypothetical protein
MVSFASLSCIEVFHLTSLGTKVYVLAYLYLDFYQVQRKSEIWVVVPEVVNFLLLEAKSPISIPPAPSPILILCCTYSTGIYSHLHNFTELFSEKSKYAIPYYTVPC